MSIDKLVSKSDLQEFYSRILPYLGGSAAAGFTPVGTVISVMGKTAPANYLACDGSVYNIADYPELANYFLQQFESKNYFGGDGTTTFAVPDLRGEFIRGTGTNSHTNQGSGAEVGVHQDGTEIPEMITRKDYLITEVSASDTQNNAVLKKDSAVPLSSANGRGYNNAISGSAYTSTLSSISYTARPTNTSVLFCIATKNIYLNPSLDFSTSEKVVGTWVDGKTAYQKTIIIDSLTGFVDNTFTTFNVDVASLNIDSVIHINGILKVSTGTWQEINYRASNSGLQTKLQAVVNGTNDRIEVLSNTSGVNGCMVYITLQYTKTTD